MTSIFRNHLRNTKISTGVGEEEAILFSISHVCTLQQREVKIQRASLLGEFLKCYKNLNPPLSSCYIFFQLCSMKTLPFGFKNDLPKLNHSLPAFTDMPNNPDSHWEGFSGSNRHSVILYYSSATPDMNCALWTSLAHTYTGHDSHFFAPSLSFITIPDRHILLGKD